MADDSEKPFDPTPSKIEKARREGNVPRSQELNTVAVFLASGIATLTVLPQIGAIAHLWLVRAAEDKGIHPELAVMMLVYITIPLLVAIAAGTLMTVLQGGGFLLTPLKVKPEKMNPSEGFKRMFGGEAAVGAMRATFIFMIAVIMMINIFKELFTQATGINPLQNYAQLALAGSERVALMAIVVAGIFCIADIIIVRNRWRKKLRMDLYELKRDSIETEGNPHIKNRRRMLHRSLLRGPINRVADASFVVANPTHIAIAIEYNYPSVPVPRVLVMATDLNAQRVKALAFERDIPVIEDRPLARRLLASAKVGRTIPKETFVAVAEIVMALSRKGATA